MRIVSEGENSCCCYCLLVMHFVESVWMGNEVAEDAEALGRHCLDRRL